MRKMMQVNSERVDSEQRGRLIVLPRVWAVAEKKPCGSVGGKRKINAGIPPLGGCTASVEVTNAEGMGFEDKQGAFRHATSQALPRVQTLSKAESPHTIDKGTKFEAAFYRKYTEAMLQRYATMSLKSGRVPSMLGQEMFRGKVTSYQVHGFDDAVIFCHDIETCIKRLSPVGQALVLRIAVQQYTFSEAAPMLGLSLRTCIRQYGVALDRVTRALLQARLLEPQKACQ